MKIILKSILSVQIVGIVLTTSIMAQQTWTVKGTVGKEKPQGDRIVVCVLGSQACMPVRVDTTQRINVANSLRKLNELPMGLYMEAKIKNASKGLSTVEALKVFFPLESCTLFRSKIAHLLNNITAMFSLGSRQINSFQEEKKGDSNGRLGNHQNAQSEKSINEFTRDWTSRSNQSSYC